MGKLKVFRQQSGFSLVEIVIGLGLTGFVLGTASYTMLAQVRMQKLLEIKQSVDSEVGLARLALMSPQGLEQGLAAAHRDQVMDCLGGRGSDCQNLSGNEFSAPANNETLNGFISLMGGVACTDGSEGSCIYRKSTTYNLDCDSDHRCYKVEFLISLEPLNFSFGPLSPKSFNVTVTDRTALERMQLAFDCTGSSLLRGMDFDRLVGECGSLGVVDGRLSNEESSNIYNQPSDFTPATIEYEYEGETRSITTSFCPDGSTSCHLGRTIAEIECPNGIQAAAFSGLLKSDWSSHTTHDCFTK